MSISITDDAVGKTVINAQGEKIGIVSEVRQGTAYVDPNPGVSDKIKAKLGWEDSDQTDYPLQEAAVESVTSDEIHLKSNL